MMRYIVILIGCLTTLIYSFPKILEKGPSVTIENNQQLVTFPDDYRGQWLVCFSFPNVFSPVCTSEVVKFIQMSDQFDRANTKILGIAPFSQQHYQLWLKHIQKENNIAIPANLELLSDRTRLISEKYDFIHPAQTPHKNIRALYILDPEGRVRAALFYPMFNGRNVTEVYRLLMAIQASDASNNGVTVENWQPGDKVHQCVPCSQKKAQQQ